MIRVFLQFALGFSLERWYNMGENKYEHPNGKEAPHAQHSPENKTEIELEYFHRKDRHHAQILPSE